MMWQNLKQEIKQAVQIMVAGLFGLAVTTLILINIFDLGADDFKNLFTSNATKSGMKNVSPKSKKEDGEEIRQYSEFVTVKHPTLGLTITTGTKFDNSTDQNIESQWCYAQKNKGKNSGFSVHLSIRKIKSGKTETFAPYSVQTLREFGLTQAQGKGLVSYCRFK